ncbi:sigma-70 family RNA polymerase sigma factor [Fulvivirgaceae bacterium BMA12]|uniref:Sigma-70 family RNA polymerase sigma factor n=1 Tax=Agaribacillus aureus TaxID=3051825 RepID=A0ABT8L7A9_9BACT|nr:sigma-70 family RNA polymerase sigma factor [Fulvivirgaceae bacterium BMA12]
MKNKMKDSGGKDPHLFLSYKSSDFDGQSDLEIFQALKNGSSVAFKYIYNKYVDFLYDYGLKFTSDSQLVEDCLHDLFLELWSRRGLNDIRNLKAYLATCFRRKIISAEKKLLKFEKITGGKEFEIKLSDQLMDLPETQHLDMDALKNALNNLPARQKEALYLRFYDHLSCDDISQIMAISRQSVYNILHKALIKLRNKLTIILIFIISI